MAGSVYAAFVLRRRELEGNGVLTHQIVKFTESEDPAHSPYVRLENVSVDAVAEAIEKRTGDRSAYKLLDRRRSSDRVRDDDDGLMLYAIPTVETDDEDDGDDEPVRFRFVSSHEGAKAVLSGVLDDLGCEYATLWPDQDQDEDADFAVEVDPTADWTLTVSESREFHELRLTPVNRGCGTSTTAAVATEDDETLHTSTAELRIDNVRLSDILYLAERTDAISPSLERYSDVPPYQEDSRRTCERFQFPKTARTSAQIVRDIQRNIGTPQVPLAELWNIVMDGVKFFTQY